MISFICRIFWAFNNLNPATNQVHEERRLWKWSFFVQAVACLGCIMVINSDAATQFAALFMMYLSLPVLSLVFSKSFGLKSCFFSCFCQACHRCCPPLNPGSCRVITFRAVACLQCRCTPEAQQDALDNDTESDDGGLRGLESN